ncbi:transposase [bacterium]|nr:transposase [bacterium]
MIQRGNLGFYKHGNLPHLDTADAIQFVTFVLADAAPRFQMKRNSLGIGMRSSEESILNDRILDQGKGTCMLGSPSIANIVLRSILLNDGYSHETLAWVIMPNHVHLLLTQKKDNRLGSIVKQIKAGSTRNIRRLRQTSEAIWQRGYFDRMIRSPEHLLKTVTYIHRNPVKAGLVGCPRDWQFSSCHTFNPIATAARLGLPEDWFDAE